MAHLGAGRFAELPFPLPPVEEQQRIIAVADAHESDIDAGANALNRVLLNLKRYRAAVLKAACEGRLVPTEAEIARKEKREYEPGEVLLQRILVERRARWEADQLAKMMAKGQTPRDNRWMSKYEVPRCPDSPRLPQGWAHTSLDALCPIFVDCEHRTPKYSTDGIPTLRPRDVVNGVLHLDSAARVSEGEYETQTSRRLPVAGDIVYSRELSFGWAAVVPPDVRLCLSQGMVLFRPGDGVSSAFLNMFLNSPTGRSQAIRVAGGSAHPHINLTDIRNFEISVPPAAEQLRILSEVDRLLSVADTTEQTTRAQLARAKRLRQAVLKQAFEGKLVPQDPSDEPASVLLERLQASEAAPAKPTVAAKRAGSRKTSGRAEALPGDWSDG